MVTAFGKISRVGGGGGGGGEQRVLGWFQRFRIERLQTPNEFPNQGGVWCMVEFLFCLQKFISFEFDL